MFYFLIFLGVGILAAAITPLVIRAANRLRALDKPDLPRKIHTRPIPLLGGISPYAAFAIAALAVVFFAPELILEEVPIKKIFGVLLGGLVLMIGGFLDDKYNQKPAKQIVFPVLAALIVIASGVGIREITNPFGGGALSLVTWEKVLFWLQGVGYRLTLPADLFTFLWLMGMMYTTKFMDGLDGLVSGIAVIGSAVIFMLTMTARWHQPEVGLIAVISAGAFFGFLLWNFHPAKIFLGTGGSLFAGYLLGILAVVSGGKIATALLVVAIPVLDALWVILRRVFWEGGSPARADRKHLHFRLLDAGFSMRGAVFLLYAAALFFGILTLILQSAEKLLALGILAVIMVIGASVLVLASKKKSSP